MNTEEIKTTTIPQPNEMILVSKKDYYNSINGLKQYERPNYKKPSNDQTNVKKMQQALKKTVADFKKEMIQALADKTKFPDAGTDLGTLAAKIKDRDQATWQELADIKNISYPRSVSNTAVGINQADREALKQSIYKAKQELFQEKTGFYPSGENLKTIGRYVGLYGDSGWLKDFNDTKMLELVLLDDFCDYFKKAAGFALPMLSKMPYVGPAATILSGLMGVGKDIGIDSYDKSAIVSKPWTKQFVNMPRLENKATRESEDFNPGHPNSYDKLDKIGGNMYAMDVVNNNWMACWLSPDSYGGVAMPQIQARKVFSATSTNVNQFSSDTSGQVVLAINPANIFSGSTTATGGYFIGQLNGWSRSTGTFGGATFMAGPLNPQQSLFSTFLISSFRVTVRSLLSDLNNSGMTELTYFSDQNLGLVAPIIPGNSFSSTSYKTLSNKVEGVVRQWPVFTPTMISCSTAQGMNDFFFIAITGLPQSTSNCIEIVISYSVDCTTTTTTSSANWLNFEYPDIGPGTGALINSLLSQYPWLIFLNEQDSCLLASAIRACKGNTVEIGSAVAAFTENHRSKYVTTTYSGQRLNNDLMNSEEKFSEISFDK